MSLLKHAFLTNSTKLRTQLFKVYALNSMTAQERAMMKKIAQAGSSLTPEQSEWAAGYYEQFYKQAERFARRWMGNHNFESDTEFLGDIVQEGVAKMLATIPTYFDQFKDNEGALKAHLFVAAQRAMTDKMSGRRTRKEDNSTSYTAMGRPTSWNVLMPLKIFLDNKIQEQYGSVGNVDEDTLDIIIAENRLDIDVIVEEENRKREEAIVELRQEYISTNQTEDGFEVPQRLGPINTTKAVSRYKAHWRQENLPEFGAPTSLDAPSFMGAEMDEGDELGSSISTGNLLSFMGIDNPSDLGDIIVMKDMVQRMKPIFAQIPLPLRVLLAVHYDIEPEAIQANQEVRQEMRRIAEQLGTDVAGFRKQLKTKAGARLAWSSAQAILQAIYGDDIKVLLKGIKNVSDFEDTIKSYFRVLADETSAVA